MNKIIKEDLYRYIGIIAKNYFGDYDISILHPDFSTSIF